MIKFRSALLLPLLFAACSSGSDDGTEQLDDGAGGAPNGSGTQATSTTGTSTTGAASNGMQSTNGVFLTASTSGGMTTGSLDPDDVCGGVSLETQPVETQVPREITTTIETEVPAPVAIYVVLDNSLSMGPAVGGPTGGFGPGGVGATGTGTSSTTGTSTTTGTTGTGTTGTGTGTTGGAGPTPSKWEEAVQALTDFVNDPGSEGIEIGIQYFNPESAGGMVDVCDGVVHATPAVDVGLLPDNAAAIVDSLADTGPRDSTPTVGALTGGTNFCATFEAENPDYQCIVVLVTDGQPNGCGLDSGCGMGGGSMDCVDPASAGILTPIAASGLTSGVTTFTVGMAGVTADGFALLDAIALAGGSDCTPGAAGDEACDVSETGSAGLLEALKTIRETIVVTETMTETVTETVIETVALPCQWELPDPPGGETFDPNLVNVVIAIDGVPGDPLGRVPTEADCAGEGWHYDDPEDPSSILVCPATCDLVTNNGNVNVTVELGCETEIL